MSAAEDRPGLTSAKRVSYGLLSLSEMVNFNVFSVCTVCSQLMFEIVSLERVINDEGIGLEKVSAPERERIRQWLKIINDVSKAFEWEAVQNRVDIFSSKLDKAGLSLYDLRFEFVVMKETIEMGLRFQAVYRYPDDKMVVLKQWPKQWETALNSFPSSKADIWPAIDCWALGHSTASVFHSMRALEHGLRALAMDLGKSFDIQNWQNVINEIEAEIRKLQATLPRGAAKNERLQFLAEAAKEFSYFKDGWRNYVSHGRGVYDEHQARSILEHVRSFMNDIASKLHE